MQNIITWTPWSFWTSNLVKSCLIVSRASAVYLFLGRTPLFSPAECILVIFSSHITIESKVTEFGMYSRAAEKQRQKKKQQQQQQWCCSVVAVSKDEDRRWNEFGRNINNCDYCEWAQWWRTYLQVFVFEFPNFLFLTFIY